MVSLLLHHEACYDTPTTLQASIGPSVDQTSQCASSALLKCSVQSLYHPIALGVVGSGVEFLNPQQVTHILHHVSLQDSSSI